MKHGEAFTFSNPSLYCRYSRTMPRQDELFTAETSGQKAIEALIPTEGQKFLNCNSDRKLLLTWATYRMEPIRDSVNLVTDKSLQHSPPLENLEEIFEFIETPDLQEDMFG